ncbi:MAG: sprT domain-containing protein [Bacteroidetes bacterium]|nr:sprT domain-containing protein [Bacteroidota bacterium]
MDKYKDVLVKYVPDSSADMMLELLQRFRVHLRISRKRLTKLGDFRPPVNGAPRRISVNHNLNSYNFLITLVHEIAHVDVWDRYGNRVKPHGREWKHSFRELMDPFLESGVFPEDVATVLQNYLRNARASSGSDRELHKVLARYDDIKRVYLEDLPQGATFGIPSGRTFIKMEKRRTRYRCICLQDKRVFLVNSLAEVIPEEQLKENVIY